MDIIAKLLGPVRLKVLRFFLQHEEGVFEDKDIAKRLKVSLPALRKELRFLSSLGLLKVKISLFVPTSTRTKRRKFKGWHLVRQPVLGPLRRFLFNTVPFRHDEVVSRLRGVGKIKLLILAGVFIQNDESPIDILIAGDGLRRSSIETILRAMEAEIGRELNYAVFDTDDFLYRMQAFDKFIREVLESPHQKVINRLDLKERETY